VYEVLGVGSDFRIRTNEVMDVPEGAFVVQVLHVSLPLHTVSKRRRTSRKAGRQERLDPP
jgi:hypothetical protein